MSKMNKTMVNIYKKRINYILNSLNCKSVQSAAIYAISDSQPCKHIARKITAHKHYVFINQFHK